MGSQNSNIGFHSLRVCAMGRGPRTRTAFKLKAYMMAEFEFSRDVTFLFPYINVVAKKAQLFENPPHIRFNFDHVLCVLRPDKGLVSPVDDSEDARALIIGLMGFLNQVYH
ncbi:MAG: hypothetical protein HUK40_13265 [Desulfobacter sp.]|nr:hypothetical protein [Desulfobacter sp.]